VKKGFQVRARVNISIPVYIHVSVWPPRCFVYSKQVPGTFIPLFSRFISRAHEFRTRRITVTGWKREEEKEEREADGEKIGRKRRK